MICPKCTKETLNAVEATVIKDLFTKACFKTNIYKCKCGFEIMTDFERTEVDNKEINISKIKLTFLLKQAWEAGFIANNSNHRKDAFFDPEKDKTNTIEKLLIS